MLNKFVNSSLTGISLPQKASVSRFQKTLSEIISDSYCKDQKLNILGQTIKFIDCIS